MKKHWPADQVERRKVASLTPYAKNSRTHSETQVAQIAKSIEAFGFTVPVLIDPKGGIIAGHGRVMAAELLGLVDVPVMVAKGWSADQKRAYVIADNKLAMNAGWDDDVLRDELKSLGEAGFDLDLTGFDDVELVSFLTTGEGLTDPDDVPDVPEVPVTKRGDIWICGNHRVMCGDSTIHADVDHLMAGKFAALLHADPPYGMGKQAEGVANDNIYGVNLDLFQMQWWEAFRPTLMPNGSAYIWGNAPDLWRLWYAGGLAASEQLEIRNEIVWDKKNIAGMASPLLTQYPEASERCLFFQAGQQFLSNVNSADFPDDWLPVLSYLSDQAKVSGVTASDVKRLCGCGMYAHWFTRSQFTLIPEKHYATLANAYPGSFLMEWSDLKRQWDAVKSGPQSIVASSRSHFDNSHDIMRDVWEFPRVSSKDRHGHATPKPVAMMERIMLTSLPAGGVCSEPFGGSGSTLVGAEKTGRACFCMEIQPQYCDVIVKRWQEFTGHSATLEGDGRTFAQIAEERCKAAA